MAHSNVIVLSLKKKPSVQDVHNLSLEGGFLLMIDKNKRKKTNDTETRNEEENPKHLTGLLYMETAGEAVKMLQNKTSLLARMIHLIKDMNPISKTQGVLEYIPRFDSLKIHGLRPGTSVDQIAPLFPTSKRIIVHGHRRVNFLFGGNLTTLEKNDAIATSSAVVQFKTSKEAIQAFLANEVLKIDNVNCLVTFGQQNSYRPDKKDRIWRIKKRTQKDKKKTMKDKKTQKDKKKAIKDK